LNGKRHRDSSERLKQQLVSSVKRTNNKAEIDVPSSNGPLPSDFFDEDIQTPWQKSKVEENALIRERKGIIDGVPQGFFDDKRRDGMVRETIENEAHMNEEYDRLMRELNEKHIEEEAKVFAAVQANADEQMERWMLLNAMEKLKESKLQEVCFLLP
uniref:EVG1 protein n=1 Tax=Angiostrongylus cantonensis TaxID=6313 RepID=A0A0K0DM75_ANGCA